ncbi:uncharacterized protein LOC143469826 [Clavelina lepadiformis]|uniref:uncharacterized protein LOC143469826 n=1 Tax=Clavelina lepadiformis TaxID=159417 RepID=UPI0040412343
MALWTNQPGYKEFCDENASRAYSTFSEKCRENESNNFTMVLRPRVPFKNLNITNTLAKPYISLHMKNGNSVSKPHPRPQLPKGGKGKMSQRINKGFGVAIDAVSQKFSRKSNARGRNTIKNITSPRSRYRDRVMNSPLTPNNPFNKTPTSRLRRSKRLSSLGCTPASTLACKTPIKRKIRDVNADAFIAHLETVQSGIKKLKANGGKLNTALHHFENQQRNKKSSLRERVAKDVMLIKSAANQNTYESLDADSSSQILGFSRQGLRRSMSKISIKSRKLTSRFATSTSTLTSRIQGKPVYQEVELA